MEFANAGERPAGVPRRAAMGHAEPFHLKIVGVGNDSGGSSISSATSVFRRPESKHPEIQLVTGAGPGVDDGFWKPRLGQVQERHTCDIVDEHYYRPPSGF